jgi:hypothetical protein
MVESRNSIPEREARHQGGRAMTNVRFMFDLVTIECELLGRSSVLQHSLSHSRVVKISSRQWFQYLKYDCEDPIITQFRAI